MTMFVAPLSSFFSPGPELAGLCHAAALDLYGIRYDHVRLRQIVYESTKIWWYIMYRYVCESREHSVLSNCGVLCESMMLWNVRYSWSGSGGVCGKTVFWQCTHASDATPVVGQERFAWNFYNIMHTEVEIELKEVFIVPKWTTVHLAMEGLVNSQIGWIARGRQWFHLISSLQLPWPKWTEASQFTNWSARQSKYLRYMELWWITLALVERC